MARYANDVDDYRSITSLDRGYASIVQFSIIKLGIRSISLMTDASPKGTLRERYEWINWETSSSIKECTKPAKLTDETHLLTYSPVAKLPDSVIDNVFTLQRNLVECLDATTAMEFRLCQQIGETAETLPELEELQSIRDRLVSSYSRLQNILLRIAQSQPIAAQDMLDLLYRSMEQTQSSIDTSIASLQDIQRNWN
jgi:hypothetical protein